MARVFEGPLWVHYSQAYVRSGEYMSDDHSPSFRGQENGLCGGAKQGELSLVTGLHTGQVGFTVDVLNAPPPLDDIWEEIVEVSFLVEGTDVVLENWDGDTYPIPLSPGTYRVRYCARGMQQGYEADTSPDDGSLIDFYNLAFWPAEAAEDRVIKQTSWIATYWHTQAPLQ